MKKKKKGKRKEDSCIKLDRQRHITSTAPESEAEQERENSVCPGINNF